MLIGTESHLSPNIVNSEILSENCTAACSDCNDGYGGVIVMYKKHLMFEENHLKFAGGNILSVKIEMFKKPVIICACYRSPYNDNASNDSLISDSLISNLLAICKKCKNAPIWIGIAFNLSDVDLLSNNIIGHLYPKKLNKDFLDCFKQAKLTPNCRIQYV